VANWFHKNRGIALEIALIATGMFGALSKYFAQYITTHTDWRTAYIALGCLPLVIALPLSFLTLRDVEDKPARDAAVIRWKIPIIAMSLAGVVGLLWIVLSQVLWLIEGNGVRLEYVLPFFYAAIITLPLVAFLFCRIATDPPAQTENLAIALEGVTLKQALKTSQFWLLAICFIPISYAVGAIIPNIERVLTNGGMEMGQAVGLATLTGLAVLAGRIIGGYLIDRFWAPGVAFVFLASPAIALWMLGQPEIDANIATVAILMIGFGAGVEYDLCFLCAWCWIRARHYDKPSEW